MNRDAFVEEAKQLLDRYCLKLYGEKFPINEFWDHIFNCGVARMDVNVNEICLHKHTNNIVCDISYEYSPGKTKEMSFILQQTRHQWVTIIRKFNDNN